MADLKRTEVLRKYESECYQICCRLLEDERLALDAAQTVLISLYQNTAFFGESRQKQLSMLLKESLRTCAGYVSGMATGGIQAEAVTV